VRAVVEAVPSVAGDSAPLMLGGAGVGHVVVVVLVVVLVVVVVTAVLSSASTSSTKASTLPSIVAASPVVLHGGFASAFVKAVPNLSRHFWTFAGSTVMFFAASFDLRRGDRRPSCRPPLSSSPDTCSGACRPTARRPRR
jgi:hypothetical protein